MNALFQTDVNNMLIMPTFVLCHANQSPIDTITGVENFHFNDPENNPVEISFSVRQMCNGQVNDMYAMLEDFKLVYIPDWERYYQIQVSEKDFEEGLVKDVIGKHLCEAELSQLMLYDIEINTENDIARDDYSLTVLYDPENPKQSLLHRILNDKGRNYTVKYVSPSLQPASKKSVRSFSIDGQSIDDFLRTTLAEEYNCIVKYDSTDRSISLYDTLKICADCGHRGDYTGDTCPSCGGNNIYTEYGQDTGILISTKNLAEEITVETNLDSVKTCFRITGGDEYITDCVRAVNPNGSRYIYNFSNEILADMPTELRERIESYNEMYAALQPTYKEIMNHIYDTEDEIQYYQTSMMPKNEFNTTAEDELNKLKSSVLGEIGIDSLSDKTSKNTVNNAVLGVARLEMAKGYSVEIVESTFTYISETASTWSGKFQVSHYSDEEDTATSESNIALTVTNDYETYVQQKIDRELSKYEANDIETDWSLYSYDYLRSYESAYRACEEVLIQLGIHEEDEHGKLCKELHEKYFAERQEIIAEMALRETKIESLKSLLEEFNKAKNDINKELDFEAYLGEELSKAFFHYRRDDEYNNSNYISDGLSNADLLRKAEELVEAASIQLYKASQTQYTISGTVSNFLLMDEFKHLRSECKLGNWIYIQTKDGDVYKLRLNGISGDYSSIDHLELTFSNAHNLTNPVYSLRDTILKANSMASSYPSVTHQALQGNLASQTLNDMRRLGLSAARYRIVNADNQTITIDEHGLLGREWDDLEGMYSPEQVKLVNNLMCYTDDGWKTVKQAIGKITYRDPELKKTVTKYGVIADTIIAADIYGSKFVGGHIYSENYWDINEDNGEKLGDKGSHINLNDGTFTIANGFLTFDGETLKISGDGTALDISSNQKIKDLDGNITSLNSSITQTAEQIKLEVSETYETKDDANKNYTNLNSSITQTAESITAKVTAVETNLKDNYSTTEVMQSEIKASAESINLSVSGQISEVRTYADNAASGAKDEAISDTDEKLKSYSTTEEINNSIQLSETGILSTVSTTYTAKTDFETTTNTLSSQIEQKVDSISLKVNNGDTTAGIVISVTQNGETKELKDEIKLTGMVTFEDLSGESGNTTRIDGGLIQTNNLKIGEWSINERGLSNAGGTGFFYPDWLLIGEGDKYFSYDTDTGLYLASGNFEIAGGDILLNGSTTGVGSTLASLQTQIDNLETSSGGCSCDISSLDTRVTTLENAGYATTDWVGEKFAPLSALETCASKSDLDNYVLRDEFTSAVGQCVTVEGLLSKLESYATKEYLSEEFTNIGLSSMEQLDSDIYSLYVLKTTLDSYATITYVDDADRTLSDRIDTLDTANYEIQTELIPNLQSQIDALSESCDCDLSNYVTTDYLTEKGYATESFVNNSLNDYVENDTYNEFLIEIGGDVTDLQNRVTAVESTANLNSEYINSIIAILEEMGYQV